MAEEGGMAEAELSAALSEAAAAKANFNSAAAALAEALRSLIAKREALNRLKASTRVFLSRLTNPTTLQHSHL